MQPRNFNRPPMGMFGPPGLQRGGRAFGPPGSPLSQGMNRSGGMLSRLFQRQTSSQAGRSAAGMFARAPQAGGGSLLQGLTNPGGGIQSFLNNTQQVLRTAQQIGPMVQQYGPLIRNLPAMWKLYKGFKDSTNETDTDEKALESSSKPLLIESEELEQESSHQNPSSYHRGKSTPKLYI